MATPRTLTKRRREAGAADHTQRTTSARRASKRPALNEATPQTNVAKELCTAMSIASLASNDSDHTRVIKRLPLSTLGAHTRDTPDFHATTSPRLESRLARRPQPQFPYSIQPFQLLPASPEDRVGVSVEEANRRIQQARALSDRQQQFGQLLDLASAGYIQANQCGAQEAEQDAGPESPQQEVAVSPPEAAQDPRTSPEPEARPNASSTSPNTQQQAQMQSQGPSPSAVPALPRRLTRLGPAGRLLTSRNGQGSIRILRMN